MIVNADIVMNQRIIAIQHLIYRTDAFFMCILLEKRKGNKLTKTTRIRLL